jgi:hypothetical protein
VIFIKGVQGLFRRVSDRLRLTLAKKVFEYDEKHPAKLPEQRLPKEGLSIQFEGEPEPRVYRSPSSRLDNEAK